MSYYFSLISQKIKYKVAYGLLIQNKDAGCRAHTRNIGKGRAS